MSELYQQFKREICASGAGAKLRQVPDYALVIGGKVIPIHAEIGTGLAAQILGCHQMTVVKMCASGRLREGADWRRLSERRGSYVIRREAVLALRLNGECAKN